MNPPSGIDTVGHAIQLSVAPVFLLSAIGTMLMVMINRLTRVVDLARAAEAKLPQATAGETASIHDSLRTYSRRAKLINWTITFCTITAILICAVVATLFVAAFLRFDASLLIAILFIGGMSTFIIGLVGFLREIFIATASLRIGPK